MGRPRPGPWKCMRQPGGCQCHCHTYREKEAPLTKARGKYPPWTPSQFSEAQRLRELGHTYPEISTLMGGVRTPSAIRMYLVLNDHNGTGIGRTWYTRKEVGHRLGLTQYWLDKWAADGTLTRRRFGMHWFRYERADLLTFIDKQAGRLLNVSRILDREFRGIAENSAKINARQLTSI